jgi:cellulose 1,4-beta-cellobiosidase
MFRAAALASFVFLATVSAQQAGTSTAENHPALTYQTCTASGCTTVQGSITLDANWRWVHNVGGYTNCYTGEYPSVPFLPRRTTFADRRSSASLR